MDQRKDNEKRATRRLAWLKGVKKETVLQVHRENQLRQSIEIMNQLINENAHRPESIQLLRKILRERAELQVLRGADENSLSG